VSRSTSTTVDRRTDGEHVTKLRQHEDCRLTD